MVPGWVTVAKVGVGSTTGAGAGAGTAVGVWLVSEDEPGSGAALEVSVGSLAWSLVRSLFGSVGVEVVSTVVVGVASVSPDDAGPASVVGVGSVSVIGVCSVVSARAEPVSPVAWGEVSSAILDVENGDGTCCYEILLCDVVIAREPQRENQKKKKNTTTLKCIWRECLKIPLYRRA